MASALVAVAVLLVLVVGGAVALSQATARSTDRPGPQAGTSSMHGWTGDDGPMTGWGQGRDSDRSWLWDHMDGAARMRHHDGRWQQLREHPGQWSWCSATGTTWPGGTLAGPGPTAAAAIAARSTAGAAGRRSWLHRQVGRPCRWGGWGSNPRPKDYESSALTD